MESDQDHRKESDLDYRMRVLEQVGKELNLMGKLKKDVLMEVDFFAKMIFTINQSWKLQETAFWNTHQNNNQNACTSLASFFFAYKI